MREKITEVLHHLQRRQIGVEEAANRIQEIVMEADRAAEPESGEITTESEVVEGEPAVNESDD